MTAVERGPSGTAVKRGMGVVIVGVVGRTEEVDADGIERGPSETAVKRGMGVVVVGVVGRTEEEVGGASVIGTVGRKGSCSV